MAKNIHTNYYEDNLERRHCYNCFKDFIVGEELATTVNEIYCPYCGQTENSWSSRTDEDNLEEMQLGCLGIYFHKENGEYFEQCFVCRKRINKDNIGTREGTCKGCEELGY